MEAFVERMVTERADLEEKLVKLNEFIDGPRYRTLSDAAKNLLRQQRYFMNGYADVLRQRIDALTSMREGTYADGS
jgi:hypothetical protein